MRFSSPRDFFVWLWHSQRFAARLISLGCCGGDSALCGCCCGSSEGSDDRYKKTRIMRANLFNLCNYEHLGFQQARPHLSLYPGNYHAKAQILHTFGDMLQQKESESLNLFLQIE